MTEEKETPILDTVVAILIAVVVMIGAVVTWRASVAEDASGDADYAGLRAAVNAGETRALNYINAYESYGGYVNYWRNMRLAELLEEDWEETSADELPLLEEQLTIANDLRDANDDMFPIRFMNRDGSYSVQRQMGEMWVDAAKQKELSYESHFVEADELRSKTQKLLTTLMVLAIAPILYSLVESVSGRAKLVLTIAGSVVAVIGAIAAIVIELG